MPVDSPCISVCQMNAVSRLCQGCLRTLDEIAGWGGMSDREKLLVRDQIERRKGASESAVRFKDANLGDISAAATILGVKN